MIRRHSCSRMRAPLPAPASTISTKRPSTPQPSSATVSMSHNQSLAVPRRSPLACLRTSQIGTLAESSTISRKPWRLVANSGSAEASQAAQMLKLSMRCGQADPTLARTPTLSHGMQWFPSSPPRSKPPGSDRLKVLAKCIHMGRGI